MIGHGGLLGVCFLTRPSRGSGHVKGLYPQVNTAPLSFGRIIPRVTIAKSNSIHPT